MFSKIFLIRQGRLGLTADCLGIKMYKSHSHGNNSAQRNFDTVELYRGGHEHCVNSFPGYCKLFDKS